MSWLAIQKAAPLSLLATLAAGLTATSIVRILIIFEALKGKGSNGLDTLFYVTRHEYQALAYAFAILVTLALADWHRRRTPPRRAKTQCVMIMALTLGALAPPMVHRVFIPDLNAPPEAGLLSQVLNYAGTCTAILAAPTLILVLLLTPRTADKA